MSQLDLLDEAFDLALKAFVYRLKNNPAEIADGVLARMLPDIMKARERKIEELEEVQPLSILHEVETLPFARAWELLQGEAARLDAEHRAVVDKMKELDAERVGAPA